MLPCKTGDKGCRWEFIVLKKFPENLDKRLVASVRRGFGLLLFDLQKTIDTFQKRFRRIGCYAPGQRVPPHGQALIDSRYHLHSILLAKPRIAFPIAFDADALQLSGYRVNNIKTDEPLPALRQFCFSVVDSCDWCEKHFFLFRLLPRKHGIGDPGIKNRDRTCPDFVPFQV